MFDITFDLSLNVAKNISKEVSNWCSKSGKNIKYFDVLNKNDLKLCAQ